MKTKMKNLKGLRIINFRYKITPNPNCSWPVVTYLKLYFDDQSVLKLYSPTGLLFNIEKLKVIIDEGKKISTSRIKKLTSLRIQFKNGKKFRIESEQFIEFSHEDVKETTSAQSIQFCNSEFNLNNLLNFQM
jgi:hypothetical protein